MQPQVRELQSLIAEQNAALNPQFQLLDADIAANDQAGAAQERGLEAKKIRAFGDIEQAASDKNMFFSGFSPDEQAGYTADTYLPALAQLQATIASTRSNLLGKKADLGTKAFDIAFQTREGDVQFLNQWNKMTAEQKFAASEADKDRAFKAREAEQQRTFDAGQNAANRAAQAAAAKQQGAPDGLVDKVGNMLNKGKGKDTFVSPDTYRKAQQEWVKAGGSPNSFNETFSGYINPAHQERFGGYY